MSSGEDAASSEWLTPLAARSATDRSSLWFLAAAARAIRLAAIPGAVVECGTYRGATAAAMATGFLPERRRMWLFDSFAGVPEPTEEDAGFIAKGDYAAAREEVAATFAAIGLGLSEVQVEMGPFCDTFHEARDIGTIALLHIDSDLYESVLLSLRTFYPDVAPGGVVVIDDFGWYPGAREAFFAFAAESSVAPLVERNGVSQLYWVKDRPHNRVRVDRLSRTLFAASAYLRSSSAPSNAMN